MEDFGNGLRRQSDVEQRVRDDVQAQTLFNIPDDLSSHKITFTCERCEGSLPLEERSANAARHCRDCAADRI